MECQGTPARGRLPNDSHWLSRPPKEQCEIQGRGGTPGARAQGCRRRGRSSGDGARLRKVDGWLPFEGWSGERVPPGLSGAGLAVQDHEIRRHDDGQRDEGLLPLGARAARPQGLGSALLGAGGSLRIHLPGPQFLPPRGSASARLRGPGPLSRKNIHRADYFPPRWWGTDVTITPRRKRSAPLMRNAVWLCSRWCHQREAMNSGSTTVTTWSGFFSRKSSR